MYRTPLHTLPPSSNSSTSHSLASKPVMGIDDASIIIEGLQDQLIIYITSVLGNTRDSDDILQDTNIYLINQLDEFQVGTNFRAWAYKVAYFKAMACRRDNLRRNEVVFSEELTLKLSSKSEDYAIKQTDRLSALSNCLEKLPPQDRTLIESKYTNRKSLTEHASKLGKSSNSVHKKISRLRLILKNCVELSLTTS